MKALAYFLLATSVALVLLVIFITIAAPYAKAHVPGMEQYNAWFRAQEVPDGSGFLCCDASDAYAVEPEDIRIVDHQREARIRNHWFTFPDHGVGQKGNTVLGYTGNPTGRTIAWVFRDEHDVGQPRCLSEPTAS